ncbi:MAG TPA: hypothetical protein VH459_04815 [Gaiellales bacterium]
MPWHVFAAVAALLSLSLVGLCVRSWRGRPARLAVPPAVALITMTTHSIDRHRPSVESAG